jgi:hypothetical protein
MKIFHLKKILWKKITKLLFFYKRNFVRTQQGAIYLSQQRQQNMQKISDKLPSSCGQEPQTWSKKGEDTIPQLRTVKTPYKLCG